MQRRDNNGARLEEAGQKRVNPLMMNDLQQNVLMSALLRSAPQALKFSSYCQLANPNVLLWVEKGVFRYIPRKYPHERRYGVAGKMLGEGSFGSVYEITHTLKFADGGSVICKEKSPAKKRVVKFFRSQPAIQIDAFIEATKEAAILSRLGTMNIRQVLSSPNGHTATLMMRYLPGITLENCLIEHQQGAWPLTVMQRLLLSSKLCAALQDQVHRNGVVHRDVKNENIIVNRQPDGSIGCVTIIDYNLAKVATRNDTGEAAGTMRYAAPEVLGCKNTNTATDIYSMGRVLWQVWDLDVNSFHDCTGHQIDWYRSLNRAMDTRMTFLFANTPDSLLAPKYKNAIKTMLLRVNAINRNERPTLEEMMALFDRILLEICANQNQMTASSLGLLDHIEVVNEEKAACVKDEAPSMAHSSLSPRLFAHRPLPPVVEPARQRATQCVLF